MKYLFALIFCSVLTVNAFASAALLPKTASLISADGRETVVEFEKFEMDRVTVCPGGFNFVYGNEYQFRSNFRVVFNNQTYNLYNYPCSNNPVNGFYLFDQSGPVVIGNISGMVLWFVKSGGRELLSVTSAYSHESKIETLSLYNEGMIYKYEVNQTGSVSDWD